MFPKTPLSSVRLPLRFSCISFWFSQITFHPPSPLSLDSLSRMQAFAWYRTFAQLSFCSWWNILSETWRNCFSLNRDLNWKHLSSLLRPVVHDYFLLSISAFLFPSFFFLHLPSFLTTLCKIELYQLKILIISGIKVLQQFWLCQRSSL